MLMDCEVNAKSLEIEILFFSVDIAGERLWMEVQRIAEGRNAGPVIKSMLEQNVGQYLGKILSSSLKFYFKFN